MRTPLFVAVLGALLSAPGPATASPPGLFPPDEAADLAEGHLARSAAERDLQSAIARGDVSPHEARMERFYATFRRDLVNPEYSGLADGHPGCATEVLADLRAHWDDVSPAERHLVEVTTSPVYKAWLADGGINWLEGDVDAERELTRAPCFSPETVNPNLGPFSLTTDSEHFEVHWNPSSDVTESSIDDLLGWMEASWQFEVVDRGFFQPWGMATNEMLVMVEDLNAPGIGAYATMAQCFASSSGAMTYIVVNEWSFEDDEWLQSTAPHEFFHGIQPVYGFREFWTGDSDNRWLVESTATYMQRIVYPQLYSVEVQQAFRWALEPHRSLQTADDSGLQYGLVIFLLSIEESVGTNAWHQALWDQIHERYGYDLRDEFDEVLAEYDTDFLTEWRRFIRRGATGMEVNPYLYLPTHLEDQTNGQVDDRVVGSWRADDLPLDEVVNSGSGHDRPEYLGVNYVMFEGRGYDDDEGAVITFRGEGDGAGSDPLDWVVELAAVYNDTVRHTYSMPLEYETDDDGNVTDVVGSVLVNELGEDFDYVVMAVSPVSDFGDGGATWSYTAELAESTGQGGFVPVPEDGDLEDGNGCAGCGGSVGAGSGSWLGLALLLGLAGRRARREEER